MTEAECDRFFQSRAFESRESNSVLDTRGINHYLLLYHHNGNTHVSNSTKTVPTSLSFKKNINDRIYISITYGSDLLNYGSRWHSLLPEKGFSTKHFMSDLM